MQRITASNRDIFIFPRTTEDQREQAKLAYHFQGGYWQPGGSRTQSPQGWGNLLAREIHEQEHRHDSADALSQLLFISATVPAPRPSAEWSEARAYPSHNRNAYYAIKNKTESTVYIDGRLVITSLSKEFLARLGIDRNFESIVDFSSLYANEKLDFDFQWEQKNNHWRTNPCQVAFGRLADISFLVREHENEVERVQTAKNLLPRRYATLRLKKIYKGPGLPETSFETQTSSQIAQGDRFFLIRTLVNYSDSYGGSSVGWYISLATLTPFSKFQKYRKPMNWLLRSLAMSLIPGETPATLSEAIDIRKNTGLKSKKIPNQLDERALKILLNNTSSKLLRTLVDSDYLGNLELSTIFNKARLAETVESKILEKISRKLADTETRVRLTTENISAYETKLLDNDHYIAVKNRRIQELAMDIARLENDSTRIKAETPRHKETLAAYKKLEEEIKQKVDAAAEKLNAKIKELLETEGENAIDYFDNLWYSGIVITELLYKKNNGDIVSIADDPGIITNPNAKILSVSIMMTRPAILNVTNVANADLGQRIVGPLTITMSNHQNHPTIHIAAVHPGTYFGLRNTRRSGERVQVKLHPHADYFGIDDHSPHISTYTKNKACGGELDRQLYKAFQQNSLQTLIASAMSWLSTANATDTWGRSYNKFEESNNNNTIDGKPLLVVIPEGIETTTEIYIKVNETQDITTKVELIKSEKAGWLRITVNDYEPIALPFINGRQSIDSIINTEEQKLLKQGYTKQETTTEE